PYQIGILKLDSRPLVSIIHKNFDAALLELLVNTIGSTLDRLVFIVDRKQQNMERCNRERPDDTVGIIVLFDGGGDQTGDADAVAAHFNRTLPPFGIEIGSAQ